MVIVARTGGKTTKLGLVGKKTNFNIFINHLFMGMVQPQPKSTIRTRASEAVLPCQSLTIYVEVLSILGLKLRKEEAPLNPHPVPHPVLLSTIQCIRVTTKCTLCIFGQICQYGHMGICEKNMAKWGIPEKSIKNVAQGC